MRLILALTLALVGFVSASAADAFEVPAFQPNVVDLSSTLSPSEIGRLNSEIETARNESHVFAAILLVPSLGGESIEAAAEKTFRDWKLGQKGTDNGLLFLVAMGDRKMKIETGYGLEGSIPDVEARRIVDHILKPNFRDRKFAVGLSEALKASKELVLRGDPIRLKEPRETKFDSSFFESSFFWASGLWIFLAVIVPWFFRWFAVRRARKYEKQLQPTEQESSGFRLFLGRFFMLPVVLLFIPGAYFVIFALSERERLFCPWLVLAAYVIILPANSEYLAMVGERSRRRAYEKLKDRKGRKRGANPFDRSTSWTDYSMSSDSDSSGSSSDSSFSSSSDGGSSGGGGASGDW